MVVTPLTGAGPSYKAADVLSPLSADSASGEWKPGSMRTCSTVSGDTRGSQGTYMKQKFPCVFCHVIMDDFLGCQTFFVLLLWPIPPNLFVQHQWKNLQWQREKMGVAWHVGHGHKIMLLETWRQKHYGSTLIVVIPWSRLICWPMICNIQHQHLFLLTVLTKIAHCHRDFPPWSGDANIGD